MQKRKLKVSSRMLIVWLTLAGFIFLFAPQKITNKFQLVFVNIFKWPLRIQRSIALSAHADESITDVVSGTEHSKLQNHLDNLTEELNQQRQKFEILSGLKTKFAWEGVDFVLADVVFSSLNSGSNELFIDCGKDSGLSKGQFVLSENSVIGTIGDVVGDTARVKLITDQGSKIPVRIAGLSAAGLMRGNGDNSATMTMVRHEVRVGDEVYAVKKPAFLPAPMIVGKVTQCQRDQDSPLLWNVTVQPVSNLQAVTAVTVVITRQMKNLEAETD